MIGNASADVYRAAAFAAMALSPVSYDRAGRGSGVAFCGVVPRVIPANPLEYCGIVRSLVSLSELRSSSTLLVPMLRAANLCPEYAT